MKRLDLRIALGGALIFLGVLMLLERLGVLHGASDLFWGAILSLGGIFFLYRFATAPGSEWWAAIPGSALLGLGLQSFLPSALNGWDGMVFLGLLGLGFWAVYFSGRQRWWAILPGGVLLTLGVTSVLGEAQGAAEDGGYFFLGLGLTFLVVAIVTSIAVGLHPGCGPDPDGRRIGHTLFRRAGLPLADRPGRGRAGPDLPLLPGEMTTGVALY